ncbi:tyrosine phosphatase family protein [Agrobacterium vitis]|uniref:tyrosine phosphatase family protein n=1 Tax=Agrobacterium vitis TaxID=373 RepID=UPI0015741A3F|nr:tyrosine phosphatase family protein [Agrobacterium vitis]NSZ16201.1 protein tyrosine phosphatase [Agrobacterium vitis]QZO04967.1 tyrosine phosphatase family protein [Agrobacterium vitis]UJL87114.1 protein tyrosine phosphatase [Agrobacterium vitis]
MTYFIVSPLARLAEMAVRHKAKEMISLLAKGQDFHRPAVISPGRHLTLALNDITFAGRGDLIAPQDVHVEQIIHFVKDWNQTAPLLIHCWMGVSRSPAAALIASLALHPEQDEEALAQGLRAASPFATPNIRMVEIADTLLSRGGRFVAAMKKLGRGQDADGNAPFVLPILAADPVSSSA